ncbi:MAG: carbohydrate kinase family protein [Anaerolineae bacterium]|nr:carbohydrate kinase family protein [Anaerolineae bacterium]
MFVVIGTTTADLFISGVERMPRFDGDEFTTSSLSFCRQPLTIALGGNGANSAYVLRTLGAPVRLCSGTGTNEIGTLMTGWLAARGVDLSAFLRREDGTASTTTVIDDRLNRLSFYYPGLFSTYSAADLPPSWLDGAHTLLITGYPLLPGFHGGGFAAILQTARARGVITALDIGPAVDHSATLPALTPLLPLVDILLTNEYELTVATGDHDAEVGARRLIAAGAASVVVKRGQAGACLYSPDSIIQVEGFPVQASVTIGAGDSFNAAFLYGRHAGMSPAEAAAFANAAAALVVQGGRSVLGAPDVAAVEAFLRQRRGV